MKILFGNPSYCGRRSKCSTLLVPQSSVYLSQCRSRKASLYGSSVLMVQHFFGVLKWNSMYLITQNWLSFMLTFFVEYFKFSLCLSFYLFFSFFFFLQSFNYRILCTLNDFMILLSCWGTPSFKRTCFSKLNTFLFFFRSFKLIPVCLDVLFSLTPPLGKNSNVHWKLVFSVSPNIIPNSLFFFLIFELLLSRKHKGTFHRTRHLYWMLTEVFPMRKNVLYRHCRFFALSRWRMTRGKHARIFTAIKTRPEWHQPNEDFRTENHE